MCLNGAGTLQRGRVFPEYQIVIRGSYAVLRCAGTHSNLAWTKDGIRLPSQINEYPTMEKQALLYISSTYE